MCVCSDELRASAYARGVGNCLPRNMIVSARNYMFRVACTDYRIHMYEVYLRARQLHGVTTRMGFRLGQVRHKQVKASRQRCQRFQLRGPCFDGLHTHTPPSSVKVLVQEADPTATLLSLLSRLQNKPNGVPYPTKIEVQVRNRGHLNLGLRM